MGLILYLVRISECKSEKNDHTKKLLQVVASNNRKIRAAVDVFPDLNRSLNLTIEKCKYQMALLKKDKDHLRNINTVGMEAYKKKITDPHEIVFLTRKIIKTEFGTDYIYSSINRGKESYMDIMQSKKIMKQQIKKRASLLLLST